jgi:hypothetical protein
MLPGDDPAWRTYARTILRFNSDPRMELDLSRPLTAREYALLQGLGLPGSFGLVTPENPRGDSVSAMDNEQRWQAFQADLMATVNRWLRVDGYSPDRLHVERGVALEWPRHRVLDLARRWQQSAIYWFDGAAFWVMGALTVAVPRRLPEVSG